MVKETAQTLHTKFINMSNLQFYNALDTMSNYKIKLNVQKIQR